MRKKIFFKWFKILICFIIRVLVLHQILNAMGTMCYIKPSVPTEHWEFIWIFIIDNKSWPRHKLNNSLLRNSNISCTISLILGNFFLCNCCIKYLQWFLIYLCHYQDRNEYLLFIIVNTGVSLAKEDHDNKLFHLILGVHY